MERFLVILILILFCFSSLNANLEFDRDTLKVVYENSMNYNGQFDTACVYIKNTSNTDTVSISKISIKATWINNIIFDNWDIPPLDSAPIYLIIDTTGLIPDIYKKGRLKVFSNANNPKLPLLLDLYTGVYNAIISNKYNKDIIKSSILITQNYIKIKGIYTQNISIYNLNGQQIYKGNISYINIENYKKGSYILQIKTYNNIINKKFMKL